MGLQRALAQGRDVSTIASVASFFVSRVDAAVDKLLPEDDALRGHVANAQVAGAYELYQRWMSDEKVVSLLAQGAQVQRPLWASTSPKNPAYYDLLYVDSLVAQETVNTMPDATLAATLDHGDFTGSLLESPESTAKNALLLTTLPPSISLQEITEQLEREGVDSFASSYKELLGIVASKLSRK
jgi:transaldolase